MCVKSGTYRILDLPLATRCFQMLTHDSPLLDRPCRHHLPADTMRKAKTEDVAMIPGNNVYGEIIAPHGLETVLRAVEPLATGGRAYIYRSSYSGAETLHLV